MYSYGKAYPPICGKENLSEQIILAPIKVKYRKNFIKLSLSSLSQMLFEVLKILTKEIL